MVITLEGRVIVNTGVLLKAQQQRISLFYRIVIVVVYASPVLGEG